ncbi:MAG TPA: flippase-like domain-containing protein [Pseudolabrys sp.]|jgi:putative membrane protein|nr:flippase-like domain-containing protein [Pseudolabrys sp.]
MKRLSILSAVVGLAIIATAIIVANPATVMAAIAESRWATAAVIALRVIAVGCAGLTWWLLFPAQPRPQPHICALLRYIREGTNALLPLAQIGGDVIGARLLTFWKIPGPLAAATVIVDVLAQAGTQFLFALVGFALVIAHGVGGTFIHDLAWALAVGAIALVGFYLAQRRWGEKVVSAVLKRLARGREWQINGTFETLFRELRAVHHRRVSLAAAVVCHLAVWFIGALEVWVTLRAMGYSISYSDAVAIESLAQAARGAAFIVPGAVGVQEGGLIVLCALFGVPANAALALSLIKRAADLAIGIPGLIGWHALETRRIVHE